ncbi:hypothetical protein [Peribacillus deserti]|uniref:Lipoprotein n=1 Tax=Peribacillus deserti TaxID=673318 RepID=A0A2N5M8W5_9BACI|nr:hypothetical protein [Peribacillus deserti]PLT30782.1 hypothetical protein CUU66_06415 [Peribacillus deserti]
MKYITWCLVLAILLTGCSAGDTSGQDTKAKQQAELSVKEKQKIILDYVNNKISKASDYEVEAFHSLSSVSGDNYTDDNTMYKELVNTTIPAYDKAVNEAKNIKPGIKELEKPTQQLIKTTETFQEALALQKEALEKQDKELIAKSNEKLFEYQKMLKEYHTEMKKVTKKFNVNYTPNQIN